MEGLFDILQSYVLLHLTCGGEIQNKCHDNIYFWVRISTKVIMKMYTPT